MQTRDWRDWIAATAKQLEDRTGASVAEWRSRVAAEGLRTEPDLRRWLDQQDVRGYQQMLLVHETFGYPDFLTATADELLEAQYDGRAALRPVYDAVVDAAQRAGDVVVQVRKTYVSLVGPRRTFAVVQPTTRTRVDLGLRLDGTAAGGRLLTARGVGSDAINVRVALSSPDDVDAEVRTLLRRAYEMSA